MCCPIRQRVQIGSHVDVSFRDVDFPAVAHAPHCEVRLPRIEITTLSVLFISNVSSYNVRPKAP
jgi:hypothetical protein